MTALGRDAHPLPTRGRQGASFGGSNAIRRPQIRRVPSKGCSAPGSLGPRVLLSLGFAAPQTMLPDGYLIVRLNAVAQALDAVLFGAVIATVEGSILL